MASSVDPPDERDESAVPDFNGFVRARTAALLRTAYLLTGDRHAAEDLVQTALAKTHLHWHRLRSPGNAEAYTRKIMYHQQVSWWRRNKVVELPSVHTPEGMKPDDNEGTAERLALRQALLELSAGQRAVLVLRFYEDRTEAETAQLLGCAIGTVKSQTARALARLRKIAPDLLELPGSEGASS